MFGEMSKNFNYSQINKSDVLPTLENKNLWSILSPKHIPSTIKLTPELHCLALLSKRSLDIGCGIGETCEMLRKFGISEVNGIDINSEAIKQAKLRVTDECSWFSAKDATNFYLESALHSDLIIMQAFLTGLSSKQERINALRCASLHMAQRSVLYIADFLQSWHIEKYKTRYLSWENKCNEIGTFPVFDSDHKSILYFAHHYTKNEIDYLTFHADMKISSFRTTKFKIRSGNVVHGFVAVVIK